MTAVNVTYTGKGSIYAGQPRPSTGGGYQFDSLAILSDSGNNVPANVQDQIPVIELHPSGGGVPNANNSNLTANRQYRATVSGLLAYETYTEFAFRVSGETSGAFGGNKPITRIRPISYWGNYPSGPIRQGWVGFMFRESPKYQLITFRRLDALRNWMHADLASAGNPSSVNMKWLCLTGGSMGGWGTFYYGLRRPRMFAALYGDRSRPRWDYGVGEVDHSNFDEGGKTTSVANAPEIDPIDGGGNVAELHNSIAYLADPNNYAPWIGWNVGEGDSYMPFQDHIDMVATMRATGRPFAFAWNRGNHSGGMIMSKILASYPFGTFEIGRGCPLFTECSTDIEPTIKDDSDPNQPTEGGINLNLAFDSVTETATTWSCRVTNIAGPCTVMVKPALSEIFKGNVAPKLVTIPAAKTWVVVSFSI